MKNTIYLLAFIATFIFSSCNRNPINKIFDTAKKEDNVVAVTLPGWMIKKGVSMAMKNDTVVNDVNTLNTIAGAIKKVRVLVKSHSSEAFTADMNKQVDNLSSKNFDTYAFIKSDENKVTVYGKEDKDKLKDLFFYVNGDENMAILHLKTDISIADFQKLNLSFNKDKQKNN
ncbi:MAG: DUF4252 domain-containing protein [Saprospiraceae bacterium]|nr:DUF4252 domain-containing protein [Saprospiraceae bacterium]MBK8634342.1 DUF4252 domain-containing protein [Saprospiraceae bacterium]MBP7642324.1 DUF4252 domain-containing protein [Saprospiraceae bacterium]